MGFIWVLTWGLSSRVHVTAVKVGSVTVRGIPKSAFALNTSDKSYGTIFDTGTSLAYLDYRAWLLLFNEVNRQTTAVAYVYHFQMESDANLQCYHTAAGDKFPNIEFVFEGGASIVISPYLVRQWIPHLPFFPLFLLFFRLFLYPSLSCWEEGCQGKARCIWSNADAALSNSLVSDYICCRDTISPILTNDTLKLRWSLCVSLFIMPQRSLMGDHHLSWCQIFTPVVFSSIY